jgi:DNA polymerase-3 subunit alpha (Gram-positive type)
MFYDEKGITYPRIENKPAKTPENEFAPINECFDDELTDYCAFWCAEAFSVSAAKSIYQIAAVKVKDGKVVDEYQSYVRPWDGSIGRKAAAKEANVALDVIECADDVDIVLPKFFAFVGDDTLVSTGALGNQAKLISRAARYAGLKEIKNEFFDLLDLAADTDSKFDLANNTREYLLSHFGIDEGSDSLGKARINVLLYQKLSEYGE